MKDNWLWDSKMTESEAKRILRNPDAKNFLNLAAVILARKNEPREVFKDYLEPIIFCRHWPAIKKKMRRNRWNEPRIIFWQAVYEKLSDRYRSRGIVFRQRQAAKTPFCEDVGRKIAGVRKGLGLSQQELAKKIGISQQLISRVEKGGENMSLITLVNIAAALNKKVDINFV
jgi:DNA-binding XRE family transcriptional regulator